MSEDADHRTGADLSRSMPSRAERSRGSARVPIIGRLQRHGRAPYQFRRGAEQSYFMELLVSGKRKRIWGKDIERAITEAKTQPKVGDVIGAQLISRRSVMVTERRLDADGRVVAQRERESHRNEWRVEKVQYFSARARAARLARDDHRDRSKALAEHPELKSTFLTMRAAEQLAEQRISNPADRDHFLKLVKEAMNASIRNNEPLPEVRIRERAKPDRERVPSGPSRKRDGPTR